MIKKRLITIPQRLFANRRKKFGGIVKELKPDPKFRFLLRFLKENVFLRDYRDMIRQKYNLELKRFYTEIATRFGLSVPQVATLDRLYKPRFIQG